MESSEVRDLLTKMNALVSSDDGERVDSVQLMKDPIVANRLAVELLQQLDRDAKPEVVLAPSGTASYFGYSVALAAWMRFGLMEKMDDAYVLSPGTLVKKKERVVIVLDTYDPEEAERAISLVEKIGGKVVAVLSLVGKNTNTLSNHVQLSLI